MNNIQSWKKNIAQVTGTCFPDFFFDYFSPYFFSVSIQEQKIGVPWVRLCSDYFNNLVKSELFNRQWMIGDDLLYIPINTQTRHHTIYFPAGQWMDIYTGAHFSGGTVHDLTIFNAQTPVFIRDGALVPIAPARTFKLGDTSTSRVRALLVTEPLTQRNRTIFSATSHDGDFCIQPEKDGFSLHGFSMVNYDYLCIDGINDISCVCRDAIDIPQWVNQEELDKGDGWSRYNDNRVIIHLTQSGRQPLFIHVKTTRGIARHRH